MMFKRWYDLDTTVSSAISDWENTDEETQTICAEYVIDKLKDMDFDVPMTLEDQYNYIMRRWYDKNIKVSHAMEYLRMSPDEIRKELALDIIEFIKTRKDS